MCQFLLNFLKSYKMYILLARVSVNSLELCRLGDVYEELLTVVADVLISELTFLRLVNTVHHSNVSVSIRNTLVGFKHIIQNNSYKIFLK